MAATNYDRGRAREYRSMNLIEVAGYEPIRSAGSHGTWDVIGVSDTGILLVQVKLNEKPTPAEYEAMHRAACPPNGKKLLHFYRTGRHLPEIEEL